MQVRVPAVAAPPPGSSWRCADVVGFAGRGGRVPFEMTIGVSHRCRGRRRWRSDTCCGLVTITSARGTTADNTLHRQVAVAGQDAASDARGRPSASFMSSRTCWRVIRRSRRRRQRCQAVIDHAQQTGAPQPYGSARSSIIAPMNCDPLQSGGQPGQIQEHAPGIA